MRTVGIAPLTTGAMLRTAQRFWDAFTVKAQYLARRKLRFRSENFVAECEKPRNVQPIRTRHTIVTAIARDGVEA